MSLPDKSHIDRVRDALWSRTRSWRSGPGRQGKVLFGSDDLVGSLLERTGIKHPPTADHIRNEVAAATSFKVAGFAPDSHLSFR